MSVPYFDVTRSQLIDWEQSGRLRGTSATNEGQWLVMEYGSRFGRPMRYVRMGDAFNNPSDAEGLIDFLDSLNFGGIIGHDYEIWHVIPEQIIANGSIAEGVPAPGIRSATRGDGDRAAVEQLIRRYVGLVVDLLCWPTHAALLSLTPYYLGLGFASRSASASEADGSCSARHVVKND